MHKTHLCALLLLLIFLSACKSQETAIHTPPPQPLPASVVLPYFCGDGFKVLHYSETSGYDHQTRDVSLSLFESLGQSCGFTVDDDRDGSTFDQLASLEQYAVIIFSNTSGDNLLSSSQRANFETYIANGGSLLGIHAASDTYRHSSANGNTTGTWDYYAELLGASVQQSPNHTSSNHSGIMDQIGDHPSTENLPQPWPKVEEYYYWQNGYYNSANTEILRVRSTGAQPYDGARPMSWGRELPGGGRVFYTALGHATSNYTSDTLFRNHLRDALLWTADPQFTLCGERKQWHRLTLTFRGPESAEQDSINPFTDYRLNVTFTHADTSFTVPGYYAADGNAAQSSANSGNKWQVRFTPNRTGTWNWTASFRTGPWIAIDDAPSAGVTSTFDGLTGSFTISPSNKLSPDNRSQGRLNYVGERYLQWEGSGKWFLKAGADAPENMLAYTDFDGVYNAGGTSYLKDWAGHGNDWQNGDPEWGNGRGHNIIGAVNYLASKGMNVFSFLPMNVDGDGKDVWPWTSHTERERFDVSKLDQWEILFEHADNLGFYLHFKTQETENDQLLDGGALGNHRKLYYRELVARFGHHLALNWNLGEENTNSDQERKDFAAYFKQLDPYDHHIVVHTYPGSKDQVYTPLLGNQSELTGASLQIGATNVHEESLEWVEKSRASGKNWVIANDEQGGANTGVTPDTGYPGFNGTDRHDLIRTSVLWGNLMAGGGGVEYYFGYSNPESDLTCNNWRSRDRMWEYSRLALEFFRAELPFWLMEPGDSLVEVTNGGGTAYGFAKKEDIYCIFLTEGGSAELDLEGSNDDFTVQWYDPRNGGALKNGSVTTVTGPGKVNLGTAPAEPGKDWAILVKRVGFVGREEVNEPKPELRLIPNPAGESVRVAWEELGRRWRQVTIRDVWGRGVLAVELDRSTYEQEIQTDELESGTYFVSLSDEAGESGAITLIIK